MTMVMMMATHARLVRGRQRSAPRPSALLRETTSLLHLRSPLCERVGRCCRRLWTVLVAASILLPVLCHAGDAATSVRMHEALLAALR